MTARALIVALALVCCGCSEKQTQDVCICIVLVAMFAWLAFMAHTVTRGSK